MKNIALLLWGVAVLSCTSQRIEQQQLPKADGRYDSEFPQQSVSDELANLSTTVKKLDCLVFYMTYVFLPDNKLDPAKLTERELNEYAIGNDVTNESVTGTAIVVYYDGEQVGMLTCAHVVDFPDTLFRFYPEGGLQSFSVKLKQQNFVAGLPEGGEVEVVASDARKDIALLKKTLSTHAPAPAVLNYPIGKTRDLEWGTVVYTMGYPLGNLMVTRAVVSKSENNGKGMFLTDALFNHGISGSPVLALRDGVPNFEWVGMASSASSKSIRYLKPGEGTSLLLSPRSPYSGEVFVDMNKSVNYGVTYSVRIEDVIRFLSSNSKIIRAKGFDQELFFK
ncbi:MAG: serine protease [Bacteroidales bacterium]|nr:serine protease [Bacteroidales bacterium]MCF6342301.1 serine protease [Bacteroidales bacterium]